MVLVHIGIRTEYIIREKNYQDSTQEVIMDS